MPLEVSEHLLGEATKVISAHDLPRLRPLPWVGAHRVYGDRLYALRFEELEHLGEVEGFEIHIAGYSRAFPGVSPLRALYGCNQAPAEKQGQQGNMPQDC